MQHPRYSIVMAPLIYSLIRILVDQAELYHNSDAIPDRFRAAYFDTEDTFDFIVVGAGSSGAVVGNRLVNSGFKVLILEAGGEMQPGQYIPSTSLLLLHRPQLDWFYLTEPQKVTCQASVKKQSSWSAGKGLGGTSLLNFLQYLRGHPKDFDAWANITGDSSWNFESVLPHFKAFENFKGEFEAEDIHGHGGEVTVQPPPFTGMSEYFVRASEEKGLPRKDLNGKYDEGCSVIYNNIKNGRRVSSYNAFIEPIRDNPDLTIYKFSHVTRVLFRNANEAYGVEYIRHGVRKMAFATKEVIISAGLVASPKLLMLSGIGPKDHLESLGIETKVASPAVGKNVQDHIAVFLGPFFMDKPLSMLLDRDVTSESFTDFIDHGTGPLSCSGTIATSMFSSTLAKGAGEGNWPDLQFIMLGTAIYSKFDIDFAHAFNVRKDILRKYYRNAKMRDSFHIIVSLNRPKQTGEIKLRSKNPFDQPHIDPKYLHDQRDMDALVEGMKAAMDLVENTTVFRSIGARLTDTVFPGCEHVEFRSEEYWRCYIIQYAISMHHLTGSCSMGKVGSAEAVVDPQLRVIGAKNLRVIDCSVMPLVPNVNTHAPAMMVGQKGASEIIKFWKPDGNNELK